jgi:hypothetical protein
VKPGFYTVNELPSNAILVMASPVPVIVGHAQVVHAPGVNPMPYPGLQTTLANHALTLTNLVEGSIHGLVCNQANQPIPGVTVNLVGPENAQTTTNAQGQFHFNDLMPGAYVVNVNGVLRVVTITSGEEEVAMAGLSISLEDGQFERVNPALKFVIDQPNVDTVGPRVQSVKVSSTDWTEAFLDEIDPQSEGYAIPTGADQFKTLPWVNVNEVLIKFSEPMQITAADISLHGVNVANYSTLFSYDAASFTAKLQLTGNAKIGPDKLVVHVNDTAKDAAGNALDGEWNNGVSTYPAGNGTAGGDFNFRFNVLPGDAHQDGHNLGEFNGVLGTDVAKVRNAQFTTTLDAAYSAFNDVNGSGNVSGTDVIATRNAQFTGLPTGNPVAPAGSGSALLDEAVDSVFTADDSGTAFGKAGVAIDTNDDSLLLLVLSSSQGSPSDGGVIPAIDGDGESKPEGVGSIDDLFATLGA